MLNSYSNFITHFYYHGKLIYDWEVEIMDEVDSAKENLQYQNDRVEDLKSQLEQAEQEKNQAAESLKEAADNVAEEYQSS